MAATAEFSPAPLLALSILSNMREEEKQSCSAGAPVAFSLVMAWCALFSFFFFFFFSSSYRHCVS
jgi:hypothetical protein